MLRRRLEKERGYAWHVFSYASTLLTMDADCRCARCVHRRDRCAARAPGRPQPRRHRDPALLRAPSRSNRPGRVVIMGTPSLASRAATRARALPLWPRDAGPGRDRGTAVQPSSAAGRTSASSASSPATQSLSFGRLVVDFDEANDGTVAVSETRLPGATAHLTLPVSHSGHAAVGAGGARGGAVPRARALRQLSGPSTDHAGAPRDPNPHPYIKETRVYGQRRHTRACLGPRARASGHAANSASSQSNIVACARAKAPVWPCSAPPEARSKMRVVTRLALISALSNSAVWCSGMS